MPDVIIAGAGACGMVAALAAARSGAAVQLIEQTGTIAGNTTRSTGLIPAAGTRFQRAAGIHDDTPGRMAADILAKNHNESDSAVTRALCDASGPTIEWLVDECGIDLVCYTDFLYPGQSRLRMHGPREGYGARLAEMLLSAVRDEPRIETRFGLPVRGLLGDADGVRGIQTEEGDIAADAVVLATSGFGANGAMVRQYLGDLAADAIYFGAPGNHGDGILWGERIGATTAAMGAFQGHPAVCVPDGPLVTWGVVVNGAILVNANGERFGDEDIGYSEFAQSVYVQPGGEAWIILDSGVYQASQGTRFDEVIQAGKIVEAATIHDLANTLGLPGDALALTIAQVNRAAAKSEQDPFGRTAFKSLEMPFFGIHVRGALFHTQGGLVVDTSARVSRQGGTLIPGLFAGGGAAAGVSGNGGTGYSSGNGLLAAVVLGKIAGDNAAR